MAGYVRQSVAEILNGENITAPPINAEFNQLQLAFGGASGHTHDGTDGNGSKIDLTTSVQGYLPTVHGGVAGLNKTDGVVDPNPLNDSTEGFNVGSKWVNTLTQRVFICLDATPTYAIWHEIAAINAQGQWLPVTTGQVDLGSSAQAFRDLYLTGAVRAATLDGELGGSAPAAITGTTVTATEGFSGDLTGNVVGDLTGNVTGSVTGSLSGTMTGDVTGTFTGTASGDFTGNFTGQVDANNNTVVNVADPVNALDAVNKQFLDATISEGTNSVLTFREDAQKLATNPEDQQYQISTGFQGYSALHYANKAEQSKVDAYAARDAAAQSEHNAANSELIATQKAASLSNALNNAEYRLIGVMI